MSDSECCDSVQVPSKNHNMRQLDAVGMSVSLTFVTNEAADLCDSSLQFTPDNVHNKTLLAMQNNGIGTKVAMAYMFQMHVLHGL